MLVINPIIDRRLSRLEAVLTPEPFRKSHLLVAKTDEMEAIQAQMIVKGTAMPDDMFIFLVPVKAKTS